MQKTEQLYVISLLSGSDMGNRRRVMKRVFVDPAKTASKKFHLSQTLFLIGFIIILRVPPMNYAKRLHRPLASGRDVKRTKPTNPHCATSPIGRCSPFSALLINIPSCSPRENERETEHGASKAA